MKISCEFGTIFCTLLVSYNLAYAQVEDPDGTDAFNDADQVEVTEGALIANLTQQNISPQIIRVACQTEATGADGVRKSCNSGWSVLNSPDGWLIVEKTVSRKTSFNGSWNLCEEVFSIYKDVIPGVPLPSRFALRAHNYSGAGAFGGGGHTDCEYTVNFVRAPN